MKVLVSEMAWPHLFQIVKQVGEVVHDDHLWSDRTRLKREIADADALVIRNATKVDKDLLDSAPRLKVVGRLGVGLDNIDLSACRERGIQVVFGRNANAVSVAEYVFAAMLAVSRPLTDATRSVKEGSWDRRLFTGTELAGRTLGIVGLGDIGGRLAKRASAFNMRIIAADPVVNTSSFHVAEYGVQLVSLDSVLAESDFISLHVPLLPSTRGMIGAEQLGRMRSNAWLINTARGGIIQEDALYRSLKARQIGGAVLDVLEVEPALPDHPLKTLDNVILTPHVAGLTDEAHTRTAIMVAEDVSRVLKGQKPLNPVL